jgi:hypothetical protein
MGTILSYQRKGVKYMRKDDKDKKGNNEDAYDYYDIQNIYSQTDCTGMIPTPPLDDAQVDGYHDIYSVPQQNATGARKFENAKDQKKNSSRPRK